MPAQAWVSLGVGIATIALGVATIALGFAGWKQKRETDAREQWWKRVDSAVTRLLIKDDPAANRVGARSLEVMADELPPHDQDRQLLRSFARLLLNSDTGHDEEGEDNGAHTLGGDHDERQ